MQEIIYSNVLLSGWVVLFTLGTSLLLGVCPKKDIYSVYKLSRRIMGLAFYALGLEILLLWLFSPRSMMPHIATLLNLSLSYLVAILLSTSLLLLLDIKRLYSKQFKYSFVSWGIFVLFVWPLTLLTNNSIRNIVLIIAAVYFFVAVLHICFRFLTIYKTVKNSLDNYYCDEEDVFTLWLNKSSLGIIILGMLGSVFCFATQWVNAVYMLIAIVFFVYVYISMHNYMVDFEPIVKVVNDDEVIVKEIPQKTSNKTNDSKSIQEYKTVLQSNMRRWIESKGYLEQGITIEKLAHINGTNRLYLSNFINTEYGCNFRDFINNLRIEYAQSKLIEDSQKSIGDIAAESGFSSATYFSKMFRKYKGVLPLEYRNTNKH